MLRPRGIAHFTIPVNNVAKSVAFYTDILGLELVRAHPDIAFLRAGKDNVVLARCEVPPKSPSLTPERMNVHHAFIIETREFEESLRFLASNGIDLIDKDERMNPGAVFSGRSAYFYDPDGNILELIDLAATAYRPIEVPVA